MNKEIKAKWLEALRSGKYKQGKDMLRSKNDEFCCLGVLCDILHPNDWKDAHDSQGLYHRNCFTAPAPAILREANLSGEASITHSTGKLMQLNDSGQTFEEIADYIEKEL